VSRGGGGEGKVEGGRWEGGREERAVGGSDDASSSEAAAAAVAVRARFCMRAGKGAVSMQSEWWIFDGMAEM
jgi:hypothetical protein